MTGTAGCRETRQALGVYVLGAIDPAERAAVDDHLATCPECREELAGLAGLPALLRRVPLAEAERIAAADQPDIDQPTEELLSSLLARAAGVKRARRWRWLAAAAAVVLLAVAGGAGGARLLQAPQPAALAWQTVARVDQQTGTHLTVRYTHIPWGTMMTVRVWGPKPGIVCQFKVVDNTGKTWTVGVWRLREGTAWYPAASTLAESSLRTFELTSGGQVLAQAPAT